MHIFFLEFHDFETGDRTRSVTRVISAGHCQKVPLAEDALSQPRLYYAVCHVLFKMLFVSYMF